MKIIEAMKEIKRLEEKVLDLGGKLGVHCVDLDYENPIYPNQREKIKEWLQSCHDSIKESQRLKIAIQKTNLDTIVSIELGDKKVEHSITEWILRRRIYANMEQVVWRALTTRGLKEGQFKNTAGEIFQTKIRLYFDPVERDKKIEEYRSEPNIIDRTLEVVNATTELVV